MVTQDYEGNALRAYRFVKSNNSRNVVGYDTIRRAATGFEGVSVSDFDTRPLSEVFDYMENKPGMLFGVFLEQLLDQLGLDPEPVDVEAEKEFFGTQAKAGKYSTDATAANKELLREYAMRWSVEQEIGDADTDEVMEAAMEVENAIESLQAAAEVVDLDLDPEWSYDEQLAVRVNEAFDLLESANESLDAEYDRRD